MPENLRPWIGITVYSNTSDPGVCSSQSEHEGESMAKVPRWVAGKSRWDSMPLESTLQFPPYWVSGSTAALDVDPQTQCFEGKKFTK